MILAIPSFRGRVAPTFDWAKRLALVEVAPNWIWRRGEAAIDAPSQRDRAERLVGLHVELLICGAISTPAFLLVQIRGIPVLSWVAGELDQVVAMLAAGSSAAALDHLPGPSPPTDMWASSGSLQDHLAVAPSLRGAPDCICPRCGRRVPLSCANQLCQACGTPMLVGI
jgi:predicted Fe-Mo cluster-binding NifX family protein